MAKDAFDTKGDVYPIWGTCLGFELLAYLSNDEKEVLTGCQSQDRALSLKFTAEFPESKIGSTMPPRMKDILATENVTVNFHHWCVTPQTFHHGNNSALNKFWTVLSTNHDDDGIEFISLFESKKYAIWGSQFHPEKNSFEWTPRYHEIPHFQRAVESAFFMASFFVEECRKSRHKFANRAQEEEHLIYNYNPTYTGKLDIDYVMQQCYFF